METNDETNDETRGLGQPTEIVEAPVADEELGRRLDEAADPPVPSSQADGAVDDGA